MRNIASIYKILTIFSKICQFTACSAILRVLSVPKGFYRRKERFVGGLRAIPAKQRREKEPFRFAAYLTNSRPQKYQKSQRKP
jgi:hypothetical protein